MVVLINELDVIKYVSSFLNSIFNENIHIEYKNSTEFYKIENQYIKKFDFWNKSQEELIKSFQNYCFKEDYVGTIFFFLSGYWEYTNNTETDIFGRFPANKSFQVLTNTLQEPVVDILVNRFSKKFKLTYKRKSENLRVFLTHDIDQLGLIYGSRILKTIAADLVFRKDIKSVLKKLAFKLSGEDPHSIKHLLELHNKFNSKGTFFFLPSVQPKETYGGYNLKFNNKKIVESINDIYKNKSSAGIHYDARYLNDDRMTDDIVKICELTNDSLTAGRAHFLKFDIKKSFDIYESSGVKLDSTGGYADSIGFRFGTSYPFKPYNFKENREYNFIEVPLIVMDGTLKGENYMKLTPHEGLDVIKKMIDKTNEYKGVFTVLWHNTSFYSNGWNKWEFVYEEMLNYLNSINSKFLSANEIIKNEMIE